MEFRALKRKRDSILDGDILIFESPFSLKSMGLKVQILLYWCYTYNCLPNPIAKIAAVSAIVRAKKIWLSVIIKRNISYILFLLFI